MKGILLSSLLSLLMQPANGSVPLGEAVCGFNSPGQHSWFAATHFSHFPSVCP